MNNNSTKRMLMLIMKQYKHCIKTCKTFTELFKTEHTTDICDEFMDDIMAVVLDMIREHKPDYDFDERDDLFYEITNAINTAVRHDEPNEKIVNMIINKIENT